MLLCLENSKDNEIKITQKDMKFVISVPENLIIVNNKEFITKLETTFTIDDDISIYNTDNRCVLQLPSCIVWYIGLCQVCSKKLAKKEFTQEDINDFFHQIKRNYKIV